MKIQFGNVEVKIPYEKYLKKFYGMENPFETMFSKPNPESFNNFFKMANSNFNRHLEEYKKWMEMHMKTSKPDGSETQENKTEN